MLLLFVVDACVEIENWSLSLMFVINACVEIENWKFAVEVVDWVCRWCLLFEVLLLMSLSFFVEIGIDEYVKR